MGVDSVGQCQTLIAVNEVITVAVTTGGCTYVGNILALLDRVLHLAVVDNIHEVLDQRLCFQYDVRHLFEADDIVLAGRLVHILQYDWHIFEDFGHTRTNLHIIL